jgi:anaerobic ribonucleoside-triphosphate reductase activating protein
VNIRVSGIINDSIVDGPGIRLTVFAQGCERNCPGCHNPETHALDGGFGISIDDIMAMAKANPLLRGLTFSGGEPFLQATAFAALARAAHGAGFDIVTYTGYTIEEIISAAGQRDGFRELLLQTDILVDGPYMEEFRTLDALYRGSANQRVIDVRATVDSK